MEEKTHVCKYCGKEFETGRSLGSHYLHCKQNPNHKNIYAKVGYKKTENAKFKDYTLYCVVCGEEYHLRLSERSFLASRYKKCCSDKCSKQLTVQHSDADLIRKHKSASLREHYKDNYKIKTCEYCGKEYSTRDRGISKFCSDECMKLSRHKKLSELAIRNNVGGLKPETTHRFYKRGFYKGIWCDSSWELAYLLYCLDHNLLIKRNKEFIEYTFEDKKIKFYPDFIVNEELIEIKGFYTPKNKAKLEQIKNVVFIDKKSIKPYLDYAIDTYGKNFTELYDKQD